MKSQHWSWHPALTGNICISWHGLVCNRGSVQILKKFYLDWRLTIYCDTSGNGISPYNQLRRMIFNMTRDIGYFLRSCQTNDSSRSFLLDLDLQIRTTVRIFTVLELRLKRGTGQRGQGCSPGPNYAFLSHSPDQTKTRARFPQI